jgi:hypothetical protein
MKKTMTALCLLTLLSACGTNPTDRTVSGGAIGAGGGAVGAAILGANPLAGAALGLGAGALTGYLTSPRRD